MIIYVIADTHFNHKLLVEKYWRIFNYEKILKINLWRIKKRDMLIHLWDICIGKDRVMHEKYIKPLQCKKLLVRWNHDRKSTHWYLNNWRDWVVDEYVLKVKWKRVLLSHIPVSELPKERYNIHWHTHDRPIPPISEYHRLYSPEIENYKPKNIEHFID